jgi:UDP:flavonoid glycosyltransferase YjiC (YdhE family)
MTRFAFVTWDGGGATPPAIGLAQELTLRGHEVMFFGYETQRKRFEAHGFTCSALRQSGSFDIYGTGQPAERIPVMANVWACPAHLEDVPEAIADSSADALVVDFMMQGALATIPRLSIPVAIALILTWSH